VVAIAFLRRFLGLDRGRVDDGPTSDEDAAQDEVPEPEPEAVPEPEPGPAPIADITCPNCGVLVPPPTGTRLCPRCRHRIVVRKLQGRTVFLAESAVAVFDAERERERLERLWTVQRRRWLDLARAVHASEDRRRTLEAAPLSEAVVVSSRSLYLSAAEVAVRGARSAKDWDEVSRLRRQQAAALAAEAGGTATPPEEAVRLHQEAMTASLRAVGRVTRRAELVGAGCCASCRADNGRSFAIADELRTPRLPHGGCPQGLCACDWWPVLSAEPKPRRRRRAAVPLPDAAVPLPEQAEEQDQAPEQGQAPEQDQAPEQERGEDATAADETP
jgi:hypothetical protein